MIALLLSLACAPTPEPVDPPAVEPAPVEAPPADVPVAYPRSTTNGERAMANLDKRIAQLRRRVKADPARLPDLLAELRLRATLAGKVSDLLQQLTLADDAAPEERAKALLALHHFDDALALDPGIADRVALARHQDLKRLETERRAAIEARPSSDSWTALADVLLAQGRPAEADAAYAQALELYRDVSPLYVADVQFRRAYALCETGPEDQRDCDRARALYEDAVRVLPGFVRAHTHLAELQWQAGETAAAIERVRPFATAEDPEPAGKLAVWLEGEEAETWRDNADRRYQALLAKQPLAWADHAAEFYSATGDVDKARELAAMDLANRDTPRSRARCEELGCP